MFFTFLSTPFIPSIFRYSLQPIYYKVSPYFQTSSQPENPHNIYGFEKRQTLRMIFRIKLPSIYDVQFTMEYMV